MTAQPATPWVEHLETMDRAIASKNAAEAIAAWRDAHTLALETGGWEAIAEVAGACLRIGEIPGFRKTCQAKARETYWTSLLRARQQRSLAGVLRIGEEFGALGARAMVEDCLRIAKDLAAEERDRATAERVRAHSAALAARFLVGAAAASR